MTNAEIIMRESIALMEQGILAGVDGVFVDENGDDVAMKVPEEIHTFDQWKKMGRIVKKGEHGIAKFAIWSPTKQTQKILDDNDGKLDKDKKKDARMYMRMASWFTKAQTQTIEEAEKARETEKAADSKPQVSSEPKKPAKASKKKAVKAKDTKKDTTPKKSKTEYLKKLCEGITKATLKKNPRRYLLIERSGNTVYICDSGWYAIKLAAKEYNEVFRKKSIYPEMKNGMRIKIEDKDRNNTYKDYAVKTAFENGFNIGEQEKKPVEIKEYTQPFGETTCRALKCGDTVKGVNDDFLKLLDNNDKWFSTENVITAIVSEKCAILPMRVDEKFAKNVA